MRKENHPIFAIKNVNFRILTTEELQPLENEFKLYLAANGIDATLWSEMIKKTDDAMYHHIKIFSDSVWFKIFSNKRYLELQKNNSHFYFDFLSDHYIVVKAEKSEVSDEILFSLSENKFSLSREEDMYQWMENGASFGDGSGYKDACMLWMKGKEDE